MAHTLYISRVNKHTHTHTHTHTYPRGCTQTNIHTHRHTGAHTQTKREREGERERERELFCLDKDDTATVIEAWVGCAQFQWLGDFASLKQHLKSNSGNASSSKAIIVSLCVNTTELPTDKRGRCTNKQRKTLKRRRLTYHLFISVLYDAMIITRITSLGSLRTKIVNFTSSDTFTEAGRHATSPIEATMIILIDLPLLCVICMFPCHRVF